MNIFNALYALFKNLSLTFRKYGVDISCLAEIAEILQFLLDRVKQKSNSMDVPYQSFIKILIQQGLDK